MDGTNRYHVCPTCLRPKMDVNGDMWYCYYCAKGGYLSGVDSLRYGLLSTLKPKTNDNLIEVVASGSYTKRLTLLDVNVAYAMDDLWDCFDTYLVDGSKGARVLRRIIEPKALVEPNKVVGISYAGKLLSTKDKPLTIVEGAYDVLNVGDVALHGSLRFAKIKAYFRHHYVILQPDGDVWLDEKKATQLLFDMGKLKHSVCIVGVNYIPNGLDIDEIDRDMVQYIPIERFKEFYDALYG